MSFSSIQKANIVLASASPRRKALLEDLGLSVTIRPTDVEETYPDHLSPLEVVLFLAALKAENVKEEHEDEVIITSDTIVCRNNTVLGKPANREEAISMLQSLSGKKHDVVTAVCIKMGKLRRTFFETTKVHFNVLANEDIMYYVDTYKPYDKAGAYGIQEWIGQIGIKKIKGCYYNVMGLPVSAVYNHLNSMFDA